MSHNQKQNITNPLQQQTQTNIKSQQVKYQLQKSNSYTKTLSIKRLINNFFLLHDFFFRFSKMKAYSADFFDIQFDAANSIINATRSGGRIGQLATFAGLCLYFIKGNSIKTRVILGFLYGYWIHHFYTFGSYLGVLITLPGVYKRTYQYYSNKPNQHNYLADLSEFMDKDIQDTKLVMSKIFPDDFKQKSYTKNSYFEKNWEKYAEIVNNDQSIKKPEIKLKYLDCFLTRYTYHSFMRWLNRVQYYVGLKQQ